MATITLSKARVVFAVWMSTPPKRETAMPRTSCCTNWAWRCSAALKWASTKPRGGVHKTAVRLEQAARVGPPVQLRLQIVNLVGVQLREMRATALHQLALKLGFGAVGV